MHFGKSLGFLFLFFSFNVFGADANGYTALYECKSGGANCNVDVATYTTASCAQTITTADSLGTIESKLATGSSPICITNGDYTSKGTIFASASGTSGNYRVLRYTRSGDNDDEPWNQTSGNQVKIHRLVINGSFWILHRVTFPPVSGGLDKTVRLEIDADPGPSLSNVIINRIHLQGSGPPSGYSYYGYSQNNCEWTYSDITFQNSVVGGAYGDLTSNDAIAVDFGCITRGRIVNNELYDWNGGIIQYGSNTGGGGPKSGSVIENNDCYNSEVSQTQGGARIKGEGCLSFKQSGTQSGPVLMLHNRIWGSRWFDGAFCCNGASGSAVAFGAGGGVNSDWIFFQNNIVFDSQHGIEHTHWSSPSSTNRSSVIGNIFYKIKPFLSSQPSFVWWAGSFGVNTTEHYLNTIIDSDVYADGPFNTNNDFRCNVNISAGTSSESNGSGTQWDYNVYLGTTHNGETNKIDKTLNTRANSTAYTDQIIRTTATAPADGTSGDFLYKVVSAGTSAASPPAYCTKLNCVTKDGTMAVKAIRGPYKFFKKLRTVSGGEATYIPYARAVNLSVLPEFGFCTDTFASRTGIGINNVDNIGANDRL